MSSDEILSQWCECNQEIAVIEAKLEALVQRRGELAALLAGGGPYMVEGVPHIAVRTKVGTYFLSPKDKWAKTPRVKQASEPPPPAPREEESLDDFFEFLSGGKV